MTPEGLDEYLGAWNDHDVERIVSLMTDDCRYYGSVGPELLGREAVGRAAVRDAVAAFFAAVPDARFDEVESLVAGDRGFAEWTLVWTDADGEEQRVRGCDLFEFRGDRVRTKNAFRKVRSS
jgi:ketosteroid isomerase-like protein